MKLRARLGLNDTWITPDVHHVCPLLRPEDGEHPDDRPRPNSKHPNQQRKIQRLPIVDLTDVNHITY